MSIVRNLQALLLVLSFLLLCFQGDGVAGPDEENPRLEIPTAEDIISRLVPRHPRLMVSAGQFQEIKKRVASDERTRDWFERLQDRAREILLQPPSQYEFPDGIHLFDVSRRVLDRIYTLALMDHLVEDDRYFRRAWKELEAAAAFPDWNPAHFLDTAEMTHALAIGYDWLFHRWGDRQRRVLRTAMIEKGLTPARLSYEGKAPYRWWVLADYNWNQVCNGGIGMAALAIGDEEPELAGMILHEALTSLPRGMKAYAPDGACPEGPGYWHYATSYNVYFLAALQSALNTDFKLGELEGFRDAGFFQIYMTGTAGTVFNFADCPAVSFPAEEMFWLAKRFHRPAYAWYQRRLARPHPLDLVWYDPEGPAFDPGTLPLDRHFRVVEAVTFRSAWEDPRALFVGFKAGDNDVNHGHLDLGSFVLDALGQRWAVDLGRDSYSLPGYHRSSTGQRWNYFRTRAESHNTLVLNPGKGPDQDPLAKTKIVRFQSRPERAFAVADLTPAYSRHASSLRRGIQVVERKWVLVQDQIKCSPPAEVWWFLHTPATIELRDNGRNALLAIGEVQLLARIQSPTRARFTVRDTVPLPTSPNPQGQESSPEVRKLSIHLENVEDEVLAVVLVPLWKGRPENWSPPPVRLEDW